jgi:hypothetical protein
MDVSFSLSVSDFKACLCVYVYGGLFILVEFHLLELASL